MSIRPGRCPHCGAPYTLATGGCAARCRDSLIAADMVADAAEGDPGEDNEPTSGIDKGGFV